VLHGYGEVRVTPGTFSWTWRCHDKSDLPWPERRLQVEETATRSIGPRKDRIRSISSDGRRNSWLPLGAGTSRQNNGLGMALELKRLSCFQQK
jgi:hypothetical protein